MKTRKKIRKKISKTADVGSEIMYNFVVVLITYCAIARHIIRGDHSGVKNKHKKNL
jgi:hypothetical protein